MAESQTTEQRVIRIVSEQLDVEVESVNAETSFIDDLGTDSLDGVEVVMALEEAFDVEITDEDAEKIKTVKDAIECVERKVADA